MARPLPARAGYTRGLGGGELLQRTSLVLLCGLLMALPASADDATLPGYLSTEALAQRLADIGASYAEKLATTRAGGTVWAGHFSSPAPGLRPALAVVGGLGPGQQGSAEVLLRLAQRLAAPDGAELLQHADVYVLALPSPDALRGAATAPYTGASVNANPSDDDRDGKLDEDGPEDLDGDGWITQLRVHDPAGKYRAHPLDPRVLIPVSPDKHESGEYSVYTEGVDNDHDGQYNEDGPGGVDFNRNWTWNYPQYAPGAGVNAVSEPETRAVADFLFAHPEIAVVYTLGPQDNLAHPWEAGNDGGAIKTGVLADDAPALKVVSELYKQQFDTAAAPPGASGDGSFAYWAYFHYGRWSLAALPWWVPEPKKEEAKPGEATPPPLAALPTAATPGQPAAAPAKPAGDEKDERGKEELRWLQWLDANHIDGFAPWTAVEDPDFPGVQVEAGGFRTLRVFNPPAGELDSLADKQLKFLTAVAGLLPQLTLDRIKVEPRGAGVYHVELRLANTGFLPTHSAMGALAGYNYPVQVTLTLPAGAIILSGRQRQLLPPLAGSGGSLELAWLVQAPFGKELHVSAASPSVGAAEADIQLMGGAS